MECNLVGKNHKMTTFYLRCKPKRRHFARPIFCFCLWWGYCQTWNKEVINTYFLKSTSRNTEAYWLKEYKNRSFSNVIFTLFVFQSIYGWRSHCLREHHNLHHKSRRQPEDTHTKNTILKKKLRGQLYVEESIWQVRKLRVFEKILEKDWGRLKLNSAKYTLRARVDGHEHQKFKPWRYV